MALVLPQVKETIEVISSKDGAIGPNADYEKYLEDLNEGHLDLLPEVQPTRFVLKTTLTDKELRAVKDAQMGIERGDTPADASMNFRISYQLVELGLALVDIVTPTDVPDALKMVKKKGKADPDFIAELDQLGITHDLINARAQALQGATATLQKK